MSINISELIWTVICFFVLLVVLKKLLFDPLVSFMAARDARIQDGISAGRTAPGWPRQRELLEKEGVRFKANGCADIARFMWEEIL